MKKNKQFFNIILIITALAWLFYSFVSIYNYSISCGRKDFRCQVVGSRLLLTNENIYFYEWKDGDDTYLLDNGDNNIAPMNYVTMNPFYLIFGLPFALLTYSDGIWAWFAWNYCLVGLILYLIKKIYPNLKASHLLYIFSFCIIGSSAWWWHAVEGQKYMTFSALLALIFWFGFHKKNGFWTGIVVCVLVAFRLNIGLSAILLLFLIDKNMQSAYLKGVFCGVFLIGGLSFSFSTIEDWKSYFQAMKLWSKWGIGELALNSVETTYNLTSLEGVNNIEKGLSSSDFPKALAHNNSSIQRWVFKITAIKIPKSVMISIYIFLSVFLVAYYLNKTKQAIREHNYILFIIIYIFSEYFLPVHRLSYYYVQWFFPILIYLSSFNLKIFTASKIFFCIGIILSSMLLSFIPFGQILSEVSIVIAFLIMIYNPFKVDNIIYELK